MIDFHSHILPDIDDGQADIEESVAMASALREAGFKTIYCTPHLIKGCYEADKQAMLAAIATFQTEVLTHFGTDAHLLKAIHLLSLFNLNDLNLKFFFQH
jgi:tyrosine-protein phosphatase YwqE